MKFHGYEISAQAMNAGHAALDGSVEMFTSRDIAAVILAHIPSSAKGWRYSTPDMAALAAAGQVISDAYHCGKVQRAGEMLNVQLWKRVGD